MLDFDQVQDTLQQLGAMTDAAEAHGTLCGLLLGGNDFARWLGFTLEKLPDPNDLLAKESLEILQELFNQTKVQLNSDDISFELLLPDEDQEFALRLLGLSSWCQGYLYGLAVNGEARLKGLSEQGRECMDDLLQISRLSHDEEETEDAEMVYTEVVEHVRLSVIFMNEEINPIVVNTQVHQ
jgi:uncharacterized protein